MSSCGVDLPIQRFYYHNDVLISCSPPSRRFLDVSAHLMEVTYPSNYVRLLHGYCGNSKRCCHAIFPFYEMGDCERKKGKPGLELYTPGKGLKPNRGIASSKEDSLSKNGRDPSHSEAINKITEEFQKCCTPPLNPRDRPELDRKKRFEESTKPPREIPRKSRMYNGLKPSRSSELSSVTEQLTNVLAADSANVNLCKDRHVDTKRRMEPRRSRNGFGRDVQDVPPGSLSHVINNNRKNRAGPDFRDDRNLRLGSEPRSLPPSLSDSRIRDTRSVEPESLPPAEPLKHSTKWQKKGPKIKSRDVAPRFQKAFAQPPCQEPEKPTEALSLKSMTHIGTISEASWDGCSLTFGKSQTQSSFNSLPSLSQVVVDKVDDVAQRPTSAGRGRGRGRFKKESEQPQEPSLTQLSEKPCEGQFSDMEVKLEPTKKNEAIETKEKENHLVEDSDKPIKEAPEEPDKLASKVNSLTDLSHSALNWADEVDEIYECQEIVMSKSHDSLEDASKNNTNNQKGRKRSLSRGEVNDGRRGSADNALSQNSRSERSWRDRDRHGGGRRSRKNSERSNKSRHSSTDRSESHHHDGRFRNNSRDRGMIKFSDRWNRNHSRERPIEETNWRLEQKVHLVTPSKEKEMPPQQGAPKQGGGILILPKEEHSPPHKNLPSLHSNHSAPPKKLFNPSNPDKPILVPNSRLGEAPAHPAPALTPEFMQISHIMSEINAPSKPIWYNPFTENFQSARKPPLIRDLQFIDTELQFLLSTCHIFQYWDQMQKLRNELKAILVEMLLTDLRFCEKENVEAHMWKIIYYNVIELLRKLMEVDVKERERYKAALIDIIDEGTDYFENLINQMEDTYRIQLDKYLAMPMLAREELQVPDITLIAIQKLYLYLGDLARYKEQTSDHPNFNLPKQWYTKANMINPKHGRPFYQLAIVASYMGRKVDAIYYYMRCLMLSTPLISAKDSMLALFDESRKRYEAADRKRKEERAKKQREKMKEKERPLSFMREVWIRPSGGKNVHRTTSTAAPILDSEDEELYNATDIEVNRRFAKSYLHVLGKLYTKTGLETLTETSLQMLREFRALLQHTPIPLSEGRFIQLLALNMFALEITKPTGDNYSSDSSAYRHALQENALVISLQMFNLILERFVQLLEESSKADPTRCPFIIPEDCIVILPAIKVWCDWLMTHVEVWNPPPSCSDLRVGTAGDCWVRIAAIVNHFEHRDYRQNVLSDTKQRDYVLVALPEDDSLIAFTPLTANIQRPAYVHNSVNMDLARVVLRLKQILFFGSVFLCGLDVPILKFQKNENGHEEYVSIVDTGSAQSETDICFESWSSSEDSEDSGKATGVEEEDDRESNSGKKPLKIPEHYPLPELEVRPRYLVPDTNCFIEHLEHLELILKYNTTATYQYTFMVPLVVVNELDGLSHGCKPGNNKHHAVNVRENAKAAMNLIQTKTPFIKCVTTKGSNLKSTIFNCEEESQDTLNNDDKILKTCENLIKNYSAKEPKKEGGGKKSRIFRNIVLLTDDRNLRIKCYCYELPTRTLPDFIKWAGLG